MNLFKYELALIPLSAFGPISQCQKPQNIALEGGWEIVGVAPLYGSYLVAQRRKWFWQTPSRKEPAVRLIRAAALA